MDERLILTLDGSTHVSSAALLRSAGDGAGGPWEPVARRGEVDGRGQARVLLCMADDMLREAGAGPRDLSAVVVGLGPGTFTGVRIAVATARALGLALAIPVLGVSTLAALAAGTARTGARPGGRWTRLVPVVDARRQQVFFAVYDVPGDGAGREGARWARNREFGVCDRDAFAAVLAQEGGGGTLVIGEDRALVGELPAGAEFASMQVESENLVIGQEWLRASETSGHGIDPIEWLAGLDSPMALEKGAPETVKPIYVRSPDADAHITKMKDPWSGPSERK